VRSGKVLPELSASGGKLLLRGEHFGKIHADDGPAWLTIIIAGHLVVPSALYAETVFRWSLLMSIGVWPLTALALTLAVLPRAKAVFIAAIWAMKAPGFE
jgi:uncharacterized protein (DUF983 family)